MQNSTLLTDERVIQITIWFIGLLGAGFVALFVYSVKKVLSELKAYRADSLLQRQEFNDELKNKFKSINFYMRQTDKLQVKHDKDLEILNDHAKEVKMKLNKQDDKIYAHGEKLARHEIEIRNFKKTG
jgi:hypothetical protein